MTDTTTVLLQKLTPFLSADAAASAPRSGESGDVIRALSELKAEIRDLVHAVKAGTRSSSPQGTTTLVVWDDSTVVPEGITTQKALLQIRTSPADKTVFHVVEHSDWPDTDISYPTNAERRKVTVHRSSQPSAKIAAILSSELAAVRYTSVIVVSGNATVKNTVRAIDNAGFLGSADVYSSDDLWMLLGGTKSTDAKGDTKGDVKSDAKVCKAAEAKPSETRLVESKVTEVKLGERVKSGSTSDDDNDDIASVDLVYPDHSIGRSSSDLTGYAEPRLPVWTRSQVQQTGEGGAASAGNTGTGAGAGVGAGVISTYRPAPVRKSRPVFHNAKKLRTEPCRDFTATGACPRGDACWFRHGG